ncbi:hypothetical protein D3C74_267240 [compost metagenome]
MLCIHGSAADFIPRHRLVLQQLGRHDPLRQMTAFHRSLRQLLPGDDPIGQLLRCNAAVHQLLPANGVVPDRPSFDRAVHQVAAVHRRRSDFGRGHRPVCQLDVLHGVVGDPSRVNRPPHDPRSVDRERGDFLPGHGFINDIVGINNALLLIGCGFFAQQILQRPRPVHTLVLRLCLNGSRHPGLFALFWQCERCSFMKSNPFIPRLRRNLSFLQQR